MTEQYWGISHTYQELCTEKIYWICPLYSFHCSNQEIDLIEGIHIGPASDALKSAICERHMSEWKWDDPSEFESIALLPYCSEYDEQHSLRTDNLKRELYEHDRVSKLLYDFVTACRLHHEGSITPGLLISFKLHDYEFDTYDTFFPHLSKNGWSGQPIYEFRQSDVSKVDKVLNGIRLHRKSEKLSSLSEAFTRFNSSYVGKLEDRLIDQMIAFESLYIADDKELGYKLRLRTAFLLGKQRVKIFKDMKEAYDLRGKIMHGSKQVDKLKLEYIIPKTEEYLRQSIRRFLILLSEGISLKTIREKLLDENVLTNGKTLTFRD